MNKELNSEKKKLLEINGLAVHFHTERGVVQAVRGVDLDIYEKETVGLVGESGSGKTITSMSIMQLVPQPPGKIAEGKILFQGEDILTYPSKRMREIRGNKISMIFQEPMTSLNPVYTIGDQIVEAIMNHQKMTKSRAWNIAVEMIDKVGIPSPEKRAKSYPHELSGGMRQRAMIALALSCNPLLLIADEPTTALDVTIQAQILDLMISLKESTGMSILLITHDLGVVAETADRVAVMYGGLIIETAETGELFSNPLHPYTWGLMRSIPKMDEEVEDLPTIPGMVPTPMNIPQGCNFNNRCWFADEKCRNETPLLEELEPGHKVRCWKCREFKELRNKPDLISVREEK